MDIKKLTQEMHRFVQAKGWYEVGSPRPQTLRNLAISLCLESAEVLEHFQWKDETDKLSDLSSEIADVALYLMQIASLSGIDLEEAVLKKLEKNYNRTWDQMAAGDTESDDSNLEPQSLTHPAEERSKQFKVTIFGGATPKPGDKVYEDAYQLGKLLGSQGWTVINGGYIGTMEAVSQGANETGGHVIGITCAEIEKWRAVTHNPWIHEEIHMPTLQQRMKAMIENGDAMAALPGGVGTLAEILMTWNQLIINTLHPRPLILIGREWKSIMEKFFDEQNDVLPQAHREWVTFVEDVQQAFNILKMHFTDFQNKL